MFDRNNVTPWTINGLRLVGDPHMTETVEDWSEVRSPSRAARRRRQGYWQRIRYVQRPKPAAYQMGDMLIAHPDIIAKIVAAARPK